MAGLGAIERARLAATLNAKLAELQALQPGAGSVLPRARLSAEVARLCLQLGGGQAHGSDDAYVGPHGKELAAIAAGKRDTMPLAELYGLMHEAVGALVEQGILTGENEEVAHAAVTHWAELEEKAHG